MFLSRWFLPFVLTIAAGGAARALSGRPLALDRDLNPRPPLRALQSAPLSMVPDRINVQDDPALTIQILREDHGRLTAVTGLNVLVNRQLMSKTDARGALRLAPACAPLAAAQVNVVAELQDRYISVTDGETPYKVTAQVPCRGIVQLIYKQDSDGGQPLGIWQIAHHGEEKMAAEVGLGFWTSPIKFVWPGGGDYYNGEVNITRGDFWDVVGHEMGHAIYDLGGLGVFGGGEHKIDQCYSDAMALSEGWASAFSAWVSVDLRDPDARFEYMVPRRAPIRFENIPADVCKGPKNEWRVTGYFWDLIDFNADHEDAQMMFKFVWDSMFKKNARTMSDVKNLLLQRGLDPRLQDSVWTLNFQ